MTLMKDIKLFCHTCCQNCKYNYGRYPTHSPLVILAHSVYTAWGKNISVADGFGQKFMKIPVINVITLLTFFNVYWISHSLLRAEVNLHNYSEQSEESEQKWSY